MRGTGTFRVLVASFSMGVAFGGQSLPTAPPARCAGCWEVVPSPNAGSPVNHLYGVAAIAANDVWAVGAFGNIGLEAWPLALHWDGDEWTHATTPPLAAPGELTAASAVSSTDVWAVGGYNTGGQALIEHWDGASWSVVANPNPGTFNRFFGVAALSAQDVWAVGQWNDGGLARTLVERWDGRNWSVVPSPSVPNQHNVLRSVTGVPGSPGELWAVGSAGTSALVLRWNGAQWSTVPIPSVGINPHLESVAAVASDDVWAVGSTGTGSGTGTLVLHWNGSTWSVVPSPNPSSTYNHLYGVAAVAPNAAWAVGDYNAAGDGKTLLLRWNGASWTQVPGDDTGPSGLPFSLNAVAAIGASDVWSVGTNSHTLVEHWNGASWSIVPSPNAGVGENILQAVSGSSPSDVWQVGSHAFGIERRTLIQHFDGERVRTMRSPNTDKRLNVLNGVAAVSGTEAWAVGSASSGDAPDQTTLILRWNGGSWSIVPSPSPGTAGLNELHAVAAVSADDVWAVGSLTNSGEFIESLALHWDGEQWSRIPSANVPGGNNAYLGVAAVASDDVWAVGYSGVIEFVPLIAHWDGVAWSVVTNPDPPSSSNVLRAVSAAGANAVWAAGTSRNDITSMTSGFTEQWDGGGWSLKGGVGEPSTMYGVAVRSPEEIWAVGDRGGLSLTGRWSGTHWTVYPSPDVTGRLHGAAAIPSGGVWAVGLRYVASVGFQTLCLRFTPGD